MQRNLLNFVANQVSLSLVVMVFSSCITPFCYSLFMQPVAIRNPRSAHSLVV